MWSIGACLDVLKCTNTNDLCHEIDEPFPHPLFLQIDTVLRFKCQCHFLNSLLRSVAVRDSLSPWSETLTQADIFEILSNYCPVSEFESCWRWKYWQMQGYQCVGKAVYSPTKSRRHLKQFLHWARSRNGPGLRKWEHRGTTRITCNKNKYIFLLFRI